MGVHLNPSLLPWFTIRQKSRRNTTKKVFPVLTYSANCSSWNCKLNSSTNSWPEVVYESHVMCADVWPSSIRGSLHWTILYHVIYLAQPILFLIWIFVLGVLNHACYMCWNFRCHVLLPTLKHGKLQASPTIPTRVHVNLRSSPRFPFSQAQDWQWWWRAYLSAGSSAFYMFLYAIYYYSFRLAITPGVATFLYFGYSLILCLGFFVLTGTVGFIACFIFVKRIYKAIHQD